MKLNTLGAPQLLDLPAGPAASAAQRLQTGASTSGRVEASAPPSQSAALQQTPGAASAHLTAQPEQVRPQHQHQQQQQQQQQEQRQNKEQSTAGRQHQPPSKAHSQQGKANAAQRQQSQTPRKPAAPSMLRTALVQHQQQVGASQSAGRVGGALEAVCKEIRRDTWNSHGLSAVCCIEQRQQVHGRGSVTLCTQ